MIFPSTRRRSTLPELMDDHSSDRARLFATLDQFRITNRLFSRSRSLLARHFILDMEMLMRGAAERAAAQSAAATRAAPRGPFTVLEIGAGGCDVAIWLALACRRRGIRVHITCIDNDPRIARHARLRIRARGVADDVTFLQFSAFDVGQLPDYDYVFCGNMLHHCTEDQARTLIGLMRTKAARKFVASDLERSPLAWIAYWGFSTLFLHGSFARTDGLLSIARAFLGSELRALMPPGMSARPRVRRQFPARLSVVGSGSAPSPPGPAHRTAVC